MKRWLMSYEEGGDSNEKNMKHLASNTDFVLPNLVQQKARRPHLLHHTSFEPSGMYHTIGHICHICIHILTYSSLLRRTVRAQGQP